MVNGYTTNTTDKIQTVPSKMQSSVPNPIDMLYLDLGIVQINFTIQIGIYLHDPM